MIPYVPGRGSIACCSFDDQWVLNMYTSMQRQTYRDVELLIRNDGTSKALYFELQNFVRSHGNKNLTVKLMKGVDEKWGMFPAVQDLLILGQGLPEITPVENPLAAERLVRAGLRVMVH